MPPFARPAVSSRAPDVWSGLPPCGFVTHCQRRVVLSRVAKMQWQPKTRGFLTHCKDAMGGVAMCCHQLDMRVAYVWMCEGEGKL